MLLLAALAVPAQEAPAEGGEYILRAGGCAACHTDSENDGPFLGGGEPLETPFGTFHAPNITPHPEHGIGGWSEEDLARSLTRGVGPGGRHYYPVFPYTSYAGMREEDIAALHAYLMSVPPAARPNRTHELPWYLRWRGVMRLWKWWFFEPRAFRPDRERSAQWNRGAYLVNVLGHCGECHTPRNAVGARRARMHLAGNPQGAEERAAPNITPDEETGIGGWTAGELVDYFEFGIKPDGDVVGGPMAEVIDEGLSHLRRGDLEAIARYLLALPPIRHRVADEDKG